MNSYERMELKDAGVTDLVLQPVRFKVLTLLSKARKPLYIEQISREIDETHRLVSHHLGIAESAGLVTSKLEFVKKTEFSRGRAGRFFSATTKLERVLREIAETISNN